MWFQFNTTYLFSSSIIFSLLGKFRFPLSFITAELLFISLALF